MVREIIKMNVSLENGRQIKDTLQLIAEYMGADSGCLKANISIDINNDLRLGITSEWRDRLSHQKYIGSDAFLAFMLLLDLAVPEPQIKYEMIEDVHGLEYISMQRLGDNSPM